MSNLQNFTSEFCISHIALVINVPMGSDDLYSSVGIPRSIATPTQNGTGAFLYQSCLVCPVAHQFLFLLYQTNMRFPTFKRFVNGIWSFKFIPVSCNRMDNNSTGFNIRSPCSCQVADIAFGAIYLCVANEKIASDSKTLCVMNIVISVWWLISSHRHHP